MTDTSARAISTGVTAASAKIAPDLRTIPFQENIQYLRGIAALSVLLYHAAHYFNVRYKQDFYLHVFPDDFGLYGVAIFFAISGYLMVSLIQKQSPVEFLWRRISRIYPIFLITTLVALALRGNGAFGRYDFASLTLAPIGPTYYPLAVEWTLVSEIFFYVAIFVIALIGFRSKITILATVWLAAIAINSLTQLSIPVIGHATLANVALMPANAAFAAGLLIPAITKLKKPALFAAGFAVCLVATTFLVPISQFRLICGIGSAALVAAAVQSQNVLPWPISLPFRKLGDWSYAIYLVHAPIFLGVFLKGALPETPLTFSLWVATAMVVAAAAGELDLFISKKLRGVGRGESTLLRVTVYGFLAIYLSVSLCYLVYASA